MGTIVPSHARPGVEAPTSPLSFNLVSSESRPLEGIMVLLTYLLTYLLAYLVVRICRPHRAGVAPSSAPAARCELYIP